MSSRCFQSSPTNHKRLAFTTVLVMTALAASAAVDVSKLPPASARPVVFATDILPILSERCYSCHGPDKQKGGLRWDDKTAALQGGEDGPVIVPGKSADSRVIHLVAGLEPDSLMPAKGDPLTTA